MIDVLGRRSETQGTTIGNLVKIILFKVITQIRIFTENNINEDEEFFMIEILLNIFYFLLIVIILVNIGRIFRKAGYSPWLALLTLIPLVNLGLIVWFGNAEWPNLQSETVDWKLSKKSTETGQITEKN